MKLQEMIQKYESALKRKPNFLTLCGYGTETNKPKKKGNWKTKKKYKLHM